MAVVENITANREDDGCPSVIARFRYRRSRLFAASAHAKVEPMRHTIEKGYQAERACSMQFLLRRRSYIELRLYTARIRCKNAFPIPDLDGRSLGRESAKRMSNPKLHEHY
jgi:hypothetical protein